MIPDQGGGKPVSIVRGAALTLAARWTDRVIGIASAIILARLLLPEDVGIIALAALALGLAETLLDLGVGVALIQNRNATKDHYDTAWTVRLIQTAVSVAVLCAAAPLIADYFNDERLIAVVRALAFVILFGGLENIGIVMLQKQMLFGTEFRFLVFRRIAGFVTTMVAAMMLRSYWALVIGALTGRAVGVGLSYLIHPMRPRLSLGRFRDIFAMSQWMLARNLGGFVYHNLHKMLVGRWHPASTMGAYSLADEISAVPAAEMMAPVNRVLFPAFAAAQHDRAELMRLFLLAQGVQTLLVVPAGVGLGLVAKDLVPVLLGDKWLAATPFLEMFAVVSSTSAFTAAGSYMLLALNRPRLAVLSLWVEIAVFALVAGTLFYQASALRIAELRLAATCVGVGSSFALVLKAVPELRVADLVKNTIRPVLAAAVMSFVIFSIDRALAMPGIWALIAKVSVGAVTYAVALLVIWVAAGRPAGAERWMLEKARLLREQVRRRIGANA